MKARLQKSPDTNTKPSTTLAPEIFTPNNFKYELSIGIIVKNELKELTRCVDSLQQLREAINCQLIITDTGSTDGTKEYARQVADTFLEFEWCDDFAAARNTGIAVAEGRWFTYFDADEFLDSDCSDLINFFNDTKHNEYGTVNISRYDYKNTNFSSYDACVLPRFTNFMRGKVFFTDKIHEYLPRYIEIYDSTTILHHTGYIGKNLQKKITRNKTPLLNKIQQDPLHVRSYLHLAASESKISTKIEICEKCLSHIDDYNNPPTNEYLVLIATLARHYYCAKLYHKLDSFAEEYINSKTSIIDPYLDVLYYLALSKFNRGDFLSAINYFNKYHDMYTQLKTNPDIAMKNSIFLTAYKEEIYISSFFTLSNAYKFLSDDNKAYETLYKCYTSDYSIDMKTTLLSKYINTLYELDKYDNIRELYDLYSKDNEKRSLVIKQLENLINPKIYLQAAIKLNSAFSSNITDGFIALVALRYSDYKLENFDKSITDIVKADKIIYESTAFSDYLYCLLINKRDDFAFIENCTIEQMMENIKQVYANYAEHPIFVKEYLESLDLSAITDAKMLNFIKNLTYAHLANLKNVHSAVRITLEHVNFIIDIYAVVSHKIICSVYDLTKIKDNLSTLPGEYSAAITLFNAREYKTSNKLKYIKYIKQALKFSPNLFKAIEMILKDVEKQIKNESTEHNEFTMLAKTIKAQIHALISAKDFATAKAILDEYSKINPNDNEIDKFYKVIYVS